MTAPISGDAPHIPTPAELADMFRPADRHHYTHCVCPDHDQLLDPDWVHDAILTEDEDDQ